MLLVKYNNVGYHSTQVQQQLQQERERVREVEQRLTRENQQVTREKEEVTREKEQVVIRLYSASPIHAGFEGHSPLDLFSLP